MLGSLPALAKLIFFSYFRQDIHYYNARSNSQHFDALEKIETRSNSIESPSIATFGHSIGYIRRLAELTKNNSSQIDVD
jgi:hypothetical protein